jgi:hypothetical protein
MTTALLLTAALLGQNWSKPLIWMSRDVLAFQDKAYVVLPPESIAPDVVEMDWSQAGKSLLFRSSNAAEEVKGNVDFKYTLPAGRKYDDLKDHGSVEVGYFQGKGKRLVVFADTTSRWVMDR